MGLTGDIFQMLKHLVIAAAAALFAAPAFAQAPDVELEGTVTLWDNPTRTLEVMGMQVHVPDTATVHSPSATRAETGLAPFAWFRGAAMPGRTQLGFMGGTAIVIGTWDAAAGRVVADDVTIEPGENVSLGVITSSLCTTRNCDGPGDYLRGNSKVGGLPGPAMVPIRDVRMPASPVGDEGGFPLNLAGANLNGLGYAAEGYYGNAAVSVGSSTGTVSERAFHYFLFNLLAPAPQLLLNKGDREVVISRAQCRVAKDFEVRGNVHTRINPSSPTGARADTIAPNSGVVQVQYTLNGVLNRANSAVAITDAANPAIGGYRVRFNVPGACPENILVRWLPAANSANTLAYASSDSFAVDIRLD